MDLILWRHAEALDAGEGEDDLERALSKRGEKQALRMAQWLDRQLHEGTRILCSPARRTEQTALALGRKYKLRAELAPGGSVEDLLALARWPEGKSSLLVVGHQPMLGQAIARLIDLQEQDCAVRKGALWWLRSRRRSPENRIETVVVTVQSPDTL